MSQITVCETTQHLRDGDTYSQNQAPSLYYPENSPADPSFSSYNEYGYNPYGTVNNAVTAFNLVSVIR